MLMHFVKHNLEVTALSQTLIEFYLAFIKHVIVNPIDNIILNAFDVRISKHN